MAPLQRYALARRHEALRAAERTGSSQRPARGQAAPLPRENQILYGLLVGLPLGLMLWLLLALAVWSIV